MTMLITATLLALPLCVAIYRLLFHPLSKFPGPRLAAFTIYYRVYYDLVRGGEWIEHLQTLHERYGPIVRVGPGELHFINPDAYDDIHGPKLLKEHVYYENLGVPGSLPSLVEPREASKRRVKMGPFFSRKGVLKMERAIQNKVEQLVEQLSAYSDTQAPANLYRAYRAATLDIIMLYLVGEEFNALSYPKFSHPILLGMDEALKNGFFIKYFPIPLLKVPDSVTRLLMPSARPLLDQKQFIAKAAYKAGSQSAEQSGHAIFEVFLKDGEWTVPHKQLVDECLALQFAGSDTTSTTCMIGTYHLLKNPGVLNKLKQELDECKSMNYEELDKLPYLTAVLKESLRLSHGVTSPLPRVVPMSGGVIAGCAVPPGTIVSCASYFVHRDPSIFPEPFRFMPERWMESESKTRQLEKYLLAFTKGPRMCLGINLAWCELYLIFANIFKRLDLDMCEMKATDMDGGPTFRDYFLPVYHEELHVRVSLRY